MRIVAAIASAIVVAACTTSSTLQLSADRAMITTRGNAFTAPEMVMRDMLLQAAHQAVANGYEWFVVDSSKDVTTRGTIYMPAQGSAQASGNAYGWSGSADYTGPSAMPYTRPGAMVMVHFGNGPHPEHAFVASEIIALNPTR